MSDQFERENRYIVLKRNQLPYLPEQLQVRLKPALEEAAQTLPKLECVVVESGWPEYEAVWRMIEARVAGLHTKRPQCEPVTLPERKIPYQDHKLFAGWNACLDEIQKLGPLYRHADLGELEQAQATIKEMGELIDQQAAELERLKLNVNYMVEGCTCNRARGIPAETVNEIRGTV